MFPVLLGRGSLEAVIHGEVVELGEVFVDTKDFFVLDRLLHLCLCRIPLLLLLDKLLNFSGVQPRGRTALVFNFADLYHALDLRLDVPIS